MLNDLQPHLSRVCWFWPVSYFSLVLSSPAVGSWKTSEFKNKIKNIPSHFGVCKLPCQLCTHNIKRKSMLEFFSFYNKIILMSWFSHFFDRCIIFNCCARACVDVSINGSCYIKLSSWNICCVDPSSSFWAPATTTLRVLFIVF